MNKHALIRLSGFMGLMLSVSLACQFLTPTQAPPPPPPIQVVTPEPPTQAPPPVQPTPTVGQPTPQQVVVTEAPVSGGWNTFTDKNKYYSISVPSDWNHEQSTGDNLYVDTFKSPDKQALIENVVYDDGTVWSGGSNGRAALLLLNQFYSSTGKEGDIRVSDDAIQKDGSERLTWTSKGGGYSGISYFEIRHRTAFLMFTVEWMNGAKDQYLDTLNEVIKSYDVP